ncbi:hypothetical protein P691DRAFT_806849 [Macrolepiota fuliginosa MF-IS2]|uniref:Uncharacterized protein n=1 Tax=Macrolepiota fuliginosa MF-IS2 TaxID=1400762 RepID=A0A9P5XPQ9_9AGAR|nr:hypothetical protein P691DRAFT_806849 [Macrolepiota fuliginosa MF-IS2]
MQSSPEMRHSESSSDLGMGRSVGFLLSRASQRGQNPRFGTSVCVLVLALNSLHDIQYSAHFSLAPYLWTHDVCSTIVGASPFSLSIARVVCNVWEDVANDVLTMGPQWARPRPMKAAALRGMDLLSIFSLKMIVQFEHQCRKYCCRESSCLVERSDDVWRIVAQDRYALVFSSNRWVHPHMDGRHRCPKISSSATI